MNIIYNNGLNIFNGYTGVGLGTFDGLHSGHMVLVDTLGKECSKRKLTSVIYTFDKHPDDVLSSKTKTPLLTTIARKSELLSERRIDSLVIDNFTEDYARMQPEDFVRDVLVGKLKIKLAVAGFNYTFGHKGAGNVELLKKLSGKYDFEFIEIPPIIIDGEIVSSTLIRNYIKSGDVERAAKLLGRKYELSGKVVKGKRLGSKMGFPTANIYPDGTLLIPARGVYVTLSIIDGIEYKSITNVGLNPTFDENTGIRLETHIFNFDMELYGKDMKLYFIKKIRDEMRYDNPEKLKIQVHRDMKTVKKYFRNKEKTF